MKQPGLSTRPLRDPFRPERVTRMVSATPVFVNELIQEALILRDLGLSVFPVDARKKPLIKWGYYAKRKPSDKEICEKFQSVPAAGIGCACGRVSGTQELRHIVRDFDDFAEYQSWAETNPQLAADCPTVETRRGRHVHLRIPHFVKWQKLQNGELISDDHYVVLPPSRHHPKGASPHTYEWVGCPPFSSGNFPVVELRNTGFLPVDGKAPPVPRKNPGRDPITYVTFTAPVGDISEAIREAARKTQPNRIGQRNYQIGRFCRALLNVVPHDAPPAILYNAFRYWHAMALPMIGTKEFEVSFREFRAYWAKTEVSMADSFPMTTMKDAVRTSTDTGANRTESLLAACRALAEISPDGSFFLSCRTAGEILGVSHMTAKRDLRKLLECGLLRVDRLGFQDGTTRLANRFKVVDLT